MSGAEHNPICEAVTALLVFYVCGEVNEQERAAIEEHIAECADCRAQMSEEREFHEALLSLPNDGAQLDSAGILLAQCRSELAEKLDDWEHPTVKGKVRGVGWFRGWMVLHPAWSAAALVLLGLVGGTKYSQWMNARSDDGAQGQVVNVRPSSQLTDDQLSKLKVAGINFTPSPYAGSKNVRVQLNAEQPIELNGNVDDSNVRNVLTFVVKNGERFDSGMRLDCLDALKERAEDTQVRSVLLALARKDQNPAVRLKALEGLRDAGIDGTVRQTLLEALQHDSNPGVRVEAVNLLVRSLEQTPNDTVVNATTPGFEMASKPVMQAADVSDANGSVEYVIQALQSLQRNDPSRYVRLRSAAALREISARNDQ